MKIVLAEDHIIVRNGMRILLEGYSDISIVGEAANGKQLLELLKVLPDVEVVLADINMPEIDGISLISQAKTSHPSVKIVMLSMHDSEKYVMQSFAEGAWGYLLKNIDADELIFALHHIKKGNRYLCSEMAMKMVNDKLSRPEPDHADLGLMFSEREIETLKLIAEGLTNHEIAEKLFLSKRTVEGHRRNLLEKTGASNTASLIRFAIVNGVIN